MKFFIKVFFSILLIFNLTFVSSAQADPEFANTVSVGTTVGDGDKPQDVAFNSDGTKMFVLNNKSTPQCNDDDGVDQYNIETNYPFDLTRAGSIQAFKPVENEDCAPRSFAFNNNGTKMFVVGFTGKDINEYTISTAFDVSSASFVRRYSVSSQDIKPRGLAFNNDGTKMFVVGDAGNDINEYTLSTAFDVSSASFNGNDDGTGFSVASKTNTPNGVTFNSDGTKMFVTDRGGADVHSYDLDAPFDIGFTDPILSSSVPADDATGVALNANIVLTFSEIVNVESGNITIHKTSDDPGDPPVETIDVAGSKVTGSGTSQITINPGTDFDNNTEYYVLIPGTAFDDVDSNSYVGISSTTARSFTTTNAVPTLTSSVPADDAPDVERDANIILNFSENVDAETGDIKIYKISGELVETIGVTSSQVTGSGTSQITINPSSNFDSLTEYYVLIGETAFDNSSSGSYAGISSTTALSFTIKAMVDPTTDKDVTGTIDAQNMMAKTTLTEFTSIVNDRLRYLRQNRINKDFTKNNIKLDFGNAMLTSLAKFIPASKIHLTNEILTSLAIDIPTSKTYLTNTMLTSLAKVTPVSNISIPDLIPENWSSWSEGSVSMTKVGDSKNSSSKEIDVQSLALGFDTKLNNNDLLGFAMQFSQSDSEVGTSGTG
ncbi:Ig-like domain-containing protein, partial [Candidatus Pelagibacter ubique]|nr:Ig-like domain-containing protein [Candidatus Pelagibacter ubique]